MSTNILGLGPGRFRAGPGLALSNPRCEFSGHDFIPTNTKPDSCNPYIDFAQKINQSN